MVFRYLKNFFIPDEDSLKSKFLYDFTFYYIFFAFFIFVIDIFYHRVYFSGVGEIYLFYDILNHFFAALVLLFLLRFILTKIINKHFLKRILVYSSDTKAMIRTESSKRLSISGSDELDRIAFYTNSILERYDNLLELEKKNSLIDPLTSCYNRRALDLNFVSLKEKALRSKETISLVLFDIDNFKKVNDIYGHNVGDKVLIELSKIIKGVVRKYDSVYRIGGEEFLILLPNFKKNEITKFIQRLMREITYKLKKNVPQVISPITVSGGFVSSKNFDLSNNNILSEMIVHADILLYDAKSNGKNKILVK